MRECKARLYSALSGHWLEKCYVNAFLLPFTILKTPVLLLGPGYTVLLHTGASSVFVCVMGPRHSCHFSVSGGGIHTHTLTLLCSLATKGELCLQRIPLSSPFLLLPSPLPLPSPLLFLPSPLPLPSPLLLLLPSPLLISPALSPVISSVLPGPLFSLVTETGAT